MGSDEQTPKKVPDRKHLLDEIRLRAEQAETRRIEDEETERTADAEPAPVAKSASAPFPAPFPVPPKSAAAPPNDQQLTVLRDRLGIAIDRGRVDKAQEHLEALKRIAPGDPSLASYAERVSAMVEERNQVHDRRRPAASAVAPKEEPERKAKDVNRKKVAELFEGANTFYQTEKYEQAAGSVEAILALDPDNESAQRLRQQIEKARLLAEKIHVEELRRRSDDEANSINAYVTNEPPGSAKTDKDFWGTAKLSAAEPGYDLIPEEKGPVGPPRPSVLYQMTDQLSRLKIPVRPIVTVLVVLALAVAGYYIVDNIRNTVSPPLYTLLVFPAEGAQGDSGFVSLVDGWTDDLVRDMASVADLRVINTTSSRGLRGLSTSNAVVARKIGANYYLQWNIGRAAGVVSLQASLFDTIALSPIITTRQIATMRDLPVLRRDLVRRCVAAMNVKLSDESAAALNRNPQVLPEAYEAYLLGRALTRQPADTAALSQALQLFAASARIDSSFADAQSALGWMQILAYENSQELSPVWLGNASGCVERAIGLGSKTSETFRVWGMVEQSRGNYAKAVERFEAASAASPSDGESQRRLAVACLAHNESDAALKAARRALSDDPRNAASYVILGLVQQFRGDDKGSLRSIEQGVPFAQDRSEFSASFLADILVRNQQHERAIDILEDRLARVRQSAVDYYRLGRVEQNAGRKKEEWAVVLTRARDLLLARSLEMKNDPQTYSELALVYTRLGAFREATAAFNRAIQLAPANAGVLYNAAKMYALQREKSQAFEYLGRAVAKRYSLETLMDVDLYNLHSEPEFLSTVTK